MSTGNFLNYDSKFIYVPKIFRDLSDEEIELEWEYIEEGIKFIHNEAEDKIYEYLHKINIPDDIEVGIVKGESGKGFGETLNHPALTHNTVVIEDIDGNRIEIDFGFIAGYYQAGNFDYLIREYYQPTPKMWEIANGIIDILEKIYSKYCDKYKVYARFSSGETWYKRIK